MPKKKDEEKLDIKPENVHNETDDVVFEDMEDTSRATDKLKRVKEELKKCQEERKEYLDGWQRAKADFVNTKKRDEENRIASVRRAESDVIMSILPVLDSFDMALNSNSPSPDSKKSDTDWHQGIKNIQGQLLGILKEYGIEVSDPKGSKFDPSLHDSIEMRSVESAKEDGIVVEVMQKGYMKNGVVLRAARVAVGEHK